MTRLLLCAALTLAVPATACSGGSTEPKPVLTISATSSTLSLVPALTATLTVTALLDGEPVSAAGATFSTSSAGVATVAADGIVTAHAPGPVTITISLTVEGTTATTNRAFSVAEGGVILPAGNTIQTVNGYVVLTAPAGAVNEPTPVALGATAAPWVDPTLVKGAVYLVGTSALTFLQPVTLRARYVEANAPIGLAEGALGLRRAGASVWSDFASTVEAGADRVTAMITQGGVYSVGRLVPTTPCTDAPYRAWDFWIGEWTITNPGGASGGSSTITAEPGGCAIYEDYVNPVASLTPGRSISFFDPVTDKWYQTYIDNGGNEARLTSTSYSPSEIATVGPLLAPGVYRRVTWTLNGNGTVRQFGEHTLNDGVSFNTDFDLTYTRK